MTPEQIQAIDITVDVLAQILGETEPGPLARLREIVEAIGTEHAYRRLDEVRALHALADAQARGEALTLGDAARLTTSKARYALHRRDGARRTIGGSFLALATQQPKAQPRPPREIEPQHVPRVRHMGAVQVEIKIRRRLDGDAS